MVLVCKLILQDHMTNLVKGNYYPTKVGGHNHSGSKFTILLKLVAIITRVVEMNVLSSDFSR